MTMRLRKCVLANLCVILCVAVQGKVSLKPYCSLARPSSGGGARVNCLVDSKDPEGTVQWSVTTQDGQMRQDLGKCEGLTGPCWSPLSPDVTLTRWYSWSVATIANMEQRAGDTLVCSAIHLGKEDSDQCVLGGLNRFSDYPVCTIGKNECDDKGRTSFGRLKNDVICCPDGQSFIINLSDTEHPCRCNSGGGR